MPISEKRISPLLDTAARLLLVTRHQDREQARKEMTLAPQSPAALARSIAELHVDVLICAAISKPLHRELTQRGVRILPHFCGETETVLQAFCQQRLHRFEFRMPGCRGHHANGNCCSPRRALRLLKTDFNLIKEQTTS